MMSEALWFCDVGMQGTLCAVAAEDAAQHEKVRGPPASCAGRPQGMAFLSEDNIVSVHLPAIAPTLLPAHTHA